MRGLPQWGLWLGVCAALLSGCRRDRSEPTPTARVDPAAARAKAAEARYPIALGRDPANGLALALGLAWTQRCIDPEQYERKFYPEIRNAEECSCVGGAWRLSACEPSAGTAVSREPIDLYDDRDGVPKWYVPPAYHGRAHWRIRRTTSALQACGIGGNDAVIGVDGQRISGREPLHALLERMPDYLPRRISVSPALSDRTRELYYVDRATMAALAQRMPPAVRWDSTRCRSSCYLLWTNVDGGRTATYDLDRAADLPWATFAAEIMRAAEAWVAPVAPSHDAFFCSDLRTLPTVLMVQTPRGDSVELRYVVSPPPHPMWRR